MVTFSKTTLKKNGPKEYKHLTDAQCKVGRQSCVEMFMRKMQHKPGISD